MKLKDNLTTFNTTADSNQYNLLLGSLKEDLNGLFAGVNDAATLTDNFLTLFDNEKIETLIFKTKQLNARYDNYANLLRNTDYSGLVSVDFSSESERFPLVAGNYLSDKLYCDPNDQSKYAKTDYCTISDGELSLPITDNTPVKIKSVKLIYDYLAKGNNLSNTYIIKHEMKPLLLSVLIDFGSASNVTYVNFMQQSFFPFNVKGVYRSYGNEWTQIPQTDRLGVYGFTEISFASVNTTALRIDIELVSCKATNKTIRYSDDNLVSQLLNDSGLFNSMFQPTDEEFTSYIYHIGLADFNTGHKTRSAEGIFVGQPVVLKEPSQFHLQLDSSNPISEFLSVLLLKRDIDKGGNVCFEKLLRFTNTVGRPDHPVPMFGETITDKTTELTPNVVNNGKLSFMLPHNYASVTIRRMFNGSEDLKAPAITYQLSGRLLTIDCDIERYPKLESATYEITGTPIDGQLDDDVMYYYLQDNSILINWGAFGKLTDYDHSEVYPIVIMRSSGDDECVVRSLSILSNNFNEMLSSLSNINGM